MHVAPSSCAAGGGFPVGSPSWALLQACKAHAAAAWLAGGLSARSPTHRALQR